jgi:hypothetical protein
MTWDLIVQATFIATHSSVKAVRGLRLAGNKKYLAAVEQTYEDEAQQVGNLQSGSHRIQYGGCKTLLLAGHSFPCRLHHAIT